MKKLLSLMLAVLLLAGLAACGGGDAPGSAAPPPAGSSGGAVVLPPSDMELLNQAFLTGQEKGEDYPEGKRITAVMVNNISASRPTAGLSEAQILVEIQVEGGITRFMALYQDYATMPKVGSIRSARDQFFQLILPYWAFYIHDGQSTPMFQFFEDFQYGEFSLDTGRYGGNTTDPAAMNSLAWRDQPRLDAGFDWAYTEYTDAEHVISTLDSNGLDDYRSYGSPIFNFVPYTQPSRTPGGGGAAEAAVMHSPGYISYFEYDEASARYRMSQFNGASNKVEPTVDENNGQRLSFDNLVVLFAPMENYPGTEADGGLKKFDYSAGAGYYISRGGYELVYWSKGGPNHPMLLYQMDNRDEMVQVNVGNTYLAVVDDSYLPAFDAAMRSGNAGDILAGGQANPNEVDPESLTESQAN